MLIRSLVEVKELKNEKLKNLKIHQITIKYTLQVTELVFCKKLREKNHETGYFIK